MNSITGLFSANGEDRSSSARLMLYGYWRIVTLLCWGVIYLTCLLSFGISVWTMNIWDRLPANELPQYFKELNPADIAMVAQYKSDITGLGFTLGGFAGILMIFRMLGSLPLFIFSGWLAVNHRGRLMALLFAILLAVIGATGVWTSPMITWDTFLAPWLTIPAQVLNVLLWFCLIFLYVFPDGHFTPRWTRWILIALVPMTIARVFDLQLFLNPGTWPDLPALLPTIIFVGTAFFSVVYRFQHAADALRRDQLRGYVRGVLWLIGLYFILFFVTEVFPTLTGINPFVTNQVGIVYTLITEGLWYGLQLYFAWGAARSIFREKMLG